MRGKLKALTAALVLVGAPGNAATPAEIAAAFGAREGVTDIALSPDGKRVVAIIPGAAQSNFAEVIDVASGAAARVQYADGKPLRLNDCAWSANDRIVCLLYGITLVNGTRLSYTRLAAFDADGKNVLALGRRSNGDVLRISQYDGGIVDWRDGSDGAVLMMRDYVPEFSTGTRVAQTRDGLGVDLVDTRTGKGVSVEQPSRIADRYLSDGQGNIRIRVSRDADASTGELKGATTYVYRVPGETRWRDFSHIQNNGLGLRPIAVDGQANAAYALQKTNGRDALYRVALDGSLTATLVYANPLVDIDDVVRIGRRGRVIGATYVTDRRAVEYFDPEYRALAASLSRAVPQAPLVRFVSASADEKILLLHAGSDVDPGVYYVLDRASHQMKGVIPSRPEIDGLQLASVTPITYPARDGTRIPAYLTLPQGGASKNLPAIVMPHGGPAARDEWGFDWLAQFFAQRGYAVIQPNYRGSTGYGEDWEATNAFKSWRVAIGDVTDAGRWLVSSGIAAPSKLGIVGWSYGGYAALQANVLEPDLFKAVVAIAPVADLALLKEQYRPFTNFALASAYLGDAALAAEASPARHADQFHAPVLIFHGENDLNVDVAQSRRMAGALTRAKVANTLVTYPDLDHGLRDSKARADMLAKADTFLHDHLAQ